jgi:hypothetical protein
LLLIGQVLSPVHQSQLRKILLKIQMMSMYSFGVIKIALVVICSLFFAVGALKLGGSHNAVKVYQLMWFKISNCIKKQPTFM